MKTSLLFLALLILTSCTSAYSKRELEPWMESIDALKGDSNLNDMEVGQIAELLAPAFANEVFVPVFGAPYSELSAGERDEIGRSLTKHHPFPWVRLGLAEPFDQGPTGDTARQIWQPHIDRASLLPFEVAVEQRERGRQRQQAIRDSIAAGGSGNRRPSLAEMQRRMGETSQFEKEMETVVGIGALLLGLGMVENERQKAAVRQHQAIDEQLQARGKTATWFELTNPSTIQKARSLYPYSLSYDFGGEQIFRALEVRPWGHELHGAIDKIRRRVNWDRRDASHEEWSKYRDAEKALWLILETPLPR